MTSLTLRDAALADARWHRVRAGWPRYAFLLGWCAVALLAAVALGTVCGWPSPGPRR